MQGNWTFGRESAASQNDLDLTTTPSCIRPETHWMQEVQQGGSDDRLWFSLQLSRNRAEELCDAFAFPEVAGDFRDLIADGVLMAPAGYAALRLAIRAANADPGRSQGLDPMDRMLGTDILVPRKACGALQGLVAPGVLEIVDAGLALKVEEVPASITHDPVIHPKSAVLRSRVPYGSPVIIAIIDDGIGIANHRFRQGPTTTRVAYFLDQSLVGTPTAGGARDELLGRSWTAAEINDVLAVSPDDEERVYRTLGLIDPRVAQRQPLRAAVTHGTHVLDTAAGYGSRINDETLIAGRPIIAVQPPIQAAENRSDPWMPLSLKRALDWILVKADELSAKTANGDRRLPLIVNCSFSSMAGPQDGWSDVERRITQFVRTYRSIGVPELCTVVMSAGNSRLLRAAAKVPIDAERVSVPWRVLPNDRTPNFVQIWLPPQSSDAPQQVRVALRPPGQNTPGMFSVLDRAVEWTVGNDVLARLYHQSYARPAKVSAAGQPTEPQRRECVTIAIRATDDDGAPTPVVPAGLWHIDIEPANELQGPLDLDLHVHRDDVGLFARGKGRQSYFDDPNYQRVEWPGKHPPADGPPPPLGSAMVRSEGTLNAYGYGEGTVLVGGYRWSDNEPASYSASGATHMLRRSKNTNRQAFLEGPDMVAVSDESPALPGILGIGTYSGSVARLNGTSVAAPSAVRALADEIAYGGSLETLKGVLDPAGLSQAIFGKGETPPEADRPLRLGAGRLPFARSHRDAD